MQPHRLFAAILLVAVTALPTICRAQGTSDEVRWPFSLDQHASPIDAVSGVKAHLDGLYTYVPGVRGEGLRFDGYTTAMSVAAADLPNPGPHGFTLRSWVALNTYPWNWAPLFDREKARQEGFLFAIDAFGHVSLQISLNGQWRSLITKTTIPLKRWVHLAGTYQTAGGQGVLTIYVDGHAAAQMQVDGTFSPSPQDLLIGRVREATVPFPEAEVKPPYPVWYSLDGILDDLSVTGHALSGEEIATVFSATKAPTDEVLRWQKMPSGPGGPNRFGAFYASLKYEEPWDRLRQTGPGHDVVVRFDASPVRLVFWQGLNYVPAWVSEKDIWYTDEFLEVWDAGCPDGGDCEPMSDKQTRFSHVEILENNDARVVVHWRYALVEAVNLKAAWRDPRTGWTDWADEYWTVYPDGVAIRKQVLHSANVAGVHEWQETIVLHQPGRRPEDDINPDAITLGNMQGATKTYTWGPHLEGAFADPLGPSDTTTPPLANMQLVNIKSAWKPFQIVPAEGVSSDFYNNEKSYFQFECWNHWPVAQIASSDRPCVTSDRPSHSSLSHLFWKPYAQDTAMATKLLLDGMTTNALPNLVPLARSWLSPAPLQVASAGYQSEGYDPAQRAYVLTATPQAHDEPLRFTFQASANAPLANVAVLVRGWGDRAARLSINGRPIPWGKSARHALLYRLDGTDLLVYLEQRAAAPVQVTLQ